MKSGGELCIVSKITLAAVGDISFAKTPEKLFFENPGYDFFAGAAADLAKADIRFGNLESVMIPEGFPLEKTCGKPLYSSDKLISALKTANIDVLNLATNHTLDCGRIGQLNTLAQVKSIGVQPLASGQDSAEAAAMRIVEKNGTRIGFIGFVQAGDWTLAGGGGRIAYLKSRDTIDRVASCRSLVENACFILQARMFLQTTIAGLADMSLTEMIRGDPNTVLLQQTKLKNSFGGKILWQKLLIWTKEEERCRKTKVDF